MTTTAISRHGEFSVTTGDSAPGLNLPQKMGTALWLPMLLMGLMAYPIAVVLGAVRADLVANGTTTGDAANAASLGQYTTAVLFLGFSFVFAAIVFAIARILGAFRTGGGGVQQTSGRQVLSLAMPATAKAMIGLMMMGMMMLLFAVVVHVILGINVNTAVLNGDAASVTTIESWSTWIEGVRRLGVAVYLVSIALGLATIAEVIRFQTARILELPE
jgi:hypothetical protein